MSDPEPRAEWYAEGLRFECTMCGACCTGEPGVVRFSDEEAERMAAKVGVDLETFLKTRTRRVGGERSLREIRTEHGWDCVFLDREAVPGKAVCSLYEARPTQCRTFPWWPEHVSSPKAWKRLGKACEGVGRGRLVPVEEIRIDVARQRAAKG